MMIEELEEIWDECDVVPPYVIRKHIYDRKLSGVEKAVNVLNHHGGGPAIWLLGRADEFGKVQPEWLLMIKSGSIKPVKPETRDITSVSQDDFYLTVMNFSEITTLAKNIIDLLSKEELTRCV